MKVLVVSGFLGAGKTTFISELSRRTGRDFAVMENEYGQVGIDGSLLGQDAPEVNIFELTEGCICCSMKSDFASSVLTIANTVDPEYLIVEPTGVGLLSRIMSNLSQIEYERITILSPVTIVDGRSFDRFLDEYPEIMKDQISSSSTVLISKMEGAFDDERIEIASKIRSMSPSADVISNHYSTLPDSWWNGILERGLAASIPEKGNAEVDMENLGLEKIRLDSFDELILFLNGAVSGVFGKICRAKGFLEVGNLSVRFDVVGSDYSITGSERTGDSKAVFIGNGLRRSWIRSFLQRHLRVGERPGKMRPSYLPKRT